MSEHWSKLRLKIVIASGFMVLCNQFVCMTSEQMLYQLLYLHRMLLSRMAFWVDGKSTDHERFPQRSVG
jgi:hypothetical protein